MQQRQPKADAVEGAVTTLGEVKRVVAETLDEVQLDTRPHRSKETPPA